MEVTRACPARPRSRFSPFAWFRTALALRRQRRKLGVLDRHILKDIGLTESEARIEAERPIWDVPSHWRR